MLPRVSPTMPVLTLILILVNCLAYYLEIQTDGQAACEAFGLIPAHFTFTTALSSLFVHDYREVSHLAGNMAFLLVLGGVVELEIGRIRFLTVYLVAGVLGGLLHTLVNPSSADPLVGASGAIFGVMAVACSLRPRLTWIAVPMGALQIWYAVSGVEGLSWGSHIGGLAVGVIFAVVLRITGGEEMETA